MWYFAWVLGLGLAVAFAILNGLWHEIHSVPEEEEGSPATIQADAPPAPG